MAELNVSEETQQKYVKDNEEAYLASRKKQKDKDEYQGKELSKKYISISSWKARQAAKAKKEAKAAEPKSEDKTSMELFYDIVKKMLNKKQFTYSDIGMIDSAIIQLNGKINPFREIAAKEEANKKIESLKANIIQVKKEKEDVAKKEVEIKKEAAIKLIKLGVKKEVMLELEFTEEEIKEAEAEVANEVLKVVSRPEAQAEVAAAAEKAANEQH